MSRYEFRVGVTDFTAQSAWKLISPLIISEGPFQVCPKIGRYIPQEGQPTFSFYSVCFAPNSTSDCVCQVFITSYDNKFALNEIERIQKWRSSHPGDSYLIVAVNTTKKTRFTPLLKSSAEKDAKEAFGACKTCVLKYVITNPPEISGDIKQIHTAVETIIAETYERKIAGLQEALKDSDNPRLFAELADLLQIFGWAEHAIYYYRQLLLLLKHKQFWPAVPEIWDLRKIQRNLKFDTGFELIVKGLNGIIKCREEQKRTDYIQDVIECFSIVLNHAKSPEEEVFARCWIRHTADNMFADLKTPELRKEAVFLVMIAFSQMLRLNQMNFDAQSRFLTGLSDNIITKLNNRTLRQIECVSEWTHAMKVFAEYPMHKRFLRAICAQLFGCESDEMAVEKLSENIDITDFSIKYSKWNIEWILHDFLLRHNPENNQKLAQIIIENGGPGKLGKKALEILMETDNNIEPKWSLREIVRCPEFCKTNPLSSVVRFALFFKLPNFLWNQKAILSCRLDSRDAELWTNSVECTLSEHVSVGFSSECKTKGTFDKMTLVMHINKLNLCWNYRLKFPLVIVDPEEPMTFELEVPFLPAFGTKQSANFVASCLDPSIVQMEVSFEMPGLQEIRYNAQSLVVKGEKTLCVDVCEKTLNFNLVYCLDDENHEEEDCVTAFITLKSSDGTTSEFAQSFEIPERSPMGIILLNQTETMQQFQIVNTYPTSFSCVYDGITHVIEPQSKYCLVRPASEDPLELIVTEKGWEEFPVKVRSAAVPKNTVKVNLSFEEREWNVGNPRIIRVCPPSFSVSDQSDWIVSPLDCDGNQHVFIPKKPGRLLIPNFLVGQRVCETNPAYIDIVAYDFPPFVSL